MATAPAGAAVATAGATAPAGRAVATPGPAQLGGATTPAAAASAPGQPLHSVGDEQAGSDAFPDGVWSSPPDADAVENNTTSRRVTLITGQTVVVTETDGDRRFYVEADVSMEQVRSPKGTYVFPAGTDFTTFDRDLFNVDLLLDQGLADAESDSIPIIVEGESKSRRGARLTGDSFQRATGEQPRTELQSVGGAAGAVAKTEAGRVARELAADSNVRKVHLDVKYRVTLDDVQTLVNASDARSQYSVSGTGVTVAILDTGINESHPAIHESREKDFTGESVAGVPDNYGHGTHVAGIVASTNDTYTGVAPDATIWDLRVLDSDGYGKTSNIVDAMEYAAKYDADVISMSLGGPIDGVRSDSPYYDGVQYAVDNGTAVVTSAGNSGPGYNTLGDPGVQRGAITVGASDKTGNVTYFSSRGPTNGFYVKPDLVAPGDDVVSADAFSDGYVAFDGTSMSAPVVTGTAALMLEQNSTWGPARLKNALVTTADPLGSDDVYTQGAGRVNAEDAVNADVVVSPATTDFGMYTSNTTVSKTVTVTNLGTSNRTLNLSASAVDVDDGTAGTVALNRTNVTLAAGESADVALTVETGDEAGTYSGRISLDGGEYTAIFGYTRAHTLTIEKIPIRTTSVDNDSVIATANHSTTFGVSPGLTFKTLRNKSDSVTYHVVSEGHYFVMSQGLAEDNGQPVVATREVYVDGDTTVTLDEKGDTVQHAVDMSEPENESGNLSPTYVELLHLESTDAGTVGGFLTSENATASTLRVGDEGNMALITERVFVTASSTGSGAELDSPTVYYLHNVTSGITGPETRTVTTSDLGRKNVTYARTTPGETYDVTLSAWSTIYGLFGFDAGYTASVGDQTHQTIYVSPQAVAQSISAEAPAGSSESWTLDASGSGYAPDSNESVDVTVNRHPFVGITSPYWYYDTSADPDRLNAYAIAESSVSLRPRIYNDSTADRYVLSVGGTERVNTTNTSAYRSFEEDVSSGQEVELEMDARTDAMGHSVRTVTTARATYQPGNDSIPPYTYWVHVDGLDASTVAPNGSTDVTVYTFDYDSNVTNVTVLWAEAGVSTVPFDDTGIKSSTAWHRAGSLTTRSGTITLNTTGYAGNVSIAVRAVDEEGNVLETTTFNGFEVRDVPPEADAAANRTTVDVARDVAFDASGSTDNLGVTSYAWDFDGDGSVDANTTTATYNYSAPGNYTAQVTVTDTLGKTDTATVSMHVVDTIAPNATLAANHTDAQVNLTEVGFDATNSTDNHEVAYYLWDFQGDGSVDANTTTASVTHVYQIAGDHDATVMAVDPSGNVGNASVRINVTDTTPPSASIAANRTTVNASRDVTFDAGSSSDNGAIDHYEWDFDGDGTVDRNTTSPTSVYAYDAPGNYPAEVTVVDTADNTDAATVNVTVVDEVAPEAAATVNTTIAEVNLTAVQFDASGSSDNHEIATYRWDFDGDGTVDETTTGPTTANVYNAFGSQTPTVELEDPSGNVNSTTLSTITVQDATPPDPAPAANETLTNISNDVAFDAGNSTDNDEVASYAWDFDGDGVSDATGVTATHSFPDSGDYPVELTVTDAKGNNATETITITVWNNPPNATAAANKSTANETSPVALSAANASDEDGDALDYSWTQVAGPDTNLSDASAVEPTFTAPNVSDTVDVTFEVTVTDEHGKNETASVTVTVEPVLEPPSPAFDNRPSSPTGADDVTFDASGTTDADGSVETYAWDFDGDGTVDADGKVVQHNFANDTTFEVALTVTDDEGATANVTKNVTVQNAPPNATADGPGEAVEGSEVTLDATVSTDPDGDALSYTWTRVDGPSVDLTGNDTATPTFEAPPVSEETDLTYEVTVTDDDGASDTTSVTVTVAEQESGGGGGGGGAPAPADISVGGFGDFGEVPTGDSVTTSIYVTNNGDRSLGVGDVSIVGPDADEFLVRGGVTFSLDGGETRTLTVEVPEARAGDFEARLVVESNDFDDPTVSVPLSYTGIDVSTPTASPTASATDSPTDRATPTDTTPTITTTDESTSTSTGVPGFTVTAAVVALLAVLLATRARRAR